MFYKIHYYTTTEHTVFKQKYIGFANSFSFLTRAQDCKPQVKLQLQVQLLLKEFHIKTSIRI